MISIFCLRLAWGMAASLLLLSPTQVAPRFYRVQFLTVLGLAATAAAFLWSVLGPFITIALAASLFLAFLGSLVWSLEGAPAGRTTIVLTVLALAFALVLARQVEEGAATAGERGNLSLYSLNDLTSAAMLGTAMSAMLMGHSYLIAPAMSIAPLLRLLAALFVATLLRMTLAVWGLWAWTGEHSLANLTDETLLWLPLRWGLGFAGPLVLTWMAWQSAKIRSTQSATGILYVAVIFTFLGELTNQLLQHSGILL